jgi:hypothetical protein
VLSVLAAECVHVLLLLQQVHYALAWGNINLFDFNNRLQAEKVSLHLWPVPQGQEDMLNPIGIPGSHFLHCHIYEILTEIDCAIPGSCPNEDAPCVEIEFNRFAMPVSYPSEMQIKEYAHWLSARNLNKAHVHGSTTAPQMVSRFFDDIVSRIISLDFSLMILRLIVLKENSCKKSSSAILCPSSQNKRKSSCGSDGRFLRNYKHV